MRLPLILLAALFVASFITAGCKDALPAGPKTDYISDTIARWTFDNNTRDVTGHGHDGTPLRFVNFGLDRFGSKNNALIDEYASGLSVPNLADLKFTGRSSYSITAWVGTGTPDCAIFTRSPLDKSIPGYQLLLVGGKVTVKINKSGGIFTLSGTTDVTNGHPDPSGDHPAWRFIALTVSNGAVSIYVDSVLDAQATDPTLCPELNNDGSPLIGKDPFGNFFDGYLDDLIIYRHALNLNEIQTRFHEGGWYAHHDSTPAPTTGFIQGSFGGNYSIQSVCFPDSMNGYACGMGGTLLATHDAGNTWSRVYSGTTENLYQVSFIDQYRGIAGGDNILLQTSDMGVTWSQLGQGLWGNIRNLVFEADGHMIVEGGNSSYSWVFVSTDFGATWPSTTLGKQGAGTFYGLDRMWDGSSYSYVVLGTQGQALKTYDYGKTWQTGSVNGATKDFMAVSCGLTNTGWASTFWGSLYETTDGAATWTEHTIPNVSQNTQVRTVKMIGKEIWAACDNGVIIHSSDGITFTTKTLNGFSEAWNKIAIRDAHTLAFVGDNGTLYWYKY